MKPLSAKIFFLKAMYLVPIPIVMILVSYIADPANVFGKSEYEMNLVECLASGQNVENVSNYNERVTQRIYVELLDENIDVIAIGSSRIMQVSQELFPGRKFYNASVSNAVIQDYVSIIEIYDQKNLLPSTLILGLDPWILNRNNEITRWRELESEYYSGMEKVTGKKHFSYFGRSFVAQKYLMLLNPKYFQRSLRFFFLPEEEKKRELTVTSKSEGELPIKLADGSYVYEREFREQTVEKVRASAVRLEDDIRLSGFNSLSKSHREILESFVDYLKSQNVEVIFFLTPFHPAYYDRIIKSPNLKIITEAESYFREIASEKNIKIIGSYDSSKCGLYETDFYDKAHPKRESIKEMLQ